MGDYILTAIFNICIPIAELKSNQIKSNQSINQSIKQSNSQTVKQSNSHYHQAFRGKSREQNALFRRTREAK